MKCKLTCTGAQSPDLTHKVPFDNVKAGVWYAPSMRRIKGILFYADTINSGKKYTIRGPITFTVYHHQF
jgi:hypothetical protein